VHGVLSGFALLHADEGSLICLFCFSDTLFVTSVAVFETLGVL
jgi:hypothetical protein